MENFENEVARTIDTVTVDDGTQLFEKHDVPVDETAEIFFGEGKPDETWQVKESKGSGSNVGRNVAIGVGVTGGLGLLYWFKIRPWLKERRIKKAIELLQKEGMEVYDASYEDDDDFFEEEEAPAKEEKVVDFEKKDEKKDSDKKKEEKK